MSELIQLGFEGYIPVNIIFQNQSCSEVIINHSVIRQNNAQDMTAAVEDLARGSYGMDILAQRITMGTPIAKFCHSEIDFPSLVRDPALYRRVSDV